MKLLLDLFDFFSKWHLSCVEHIISSLLPWIRSRISDVSIALCCLLQRIEGLENSFIHLSLLILSLFDFLYLKLEQFILLLHNGYFLLVLLFFGPVFLFNSMKLLQTFCASILKGLINFFFILVNRGKSHDRSGGGNRTFPGFIATDLGSIAYKLIVGELIIMIWREVNYIAFLFIVFQFLPILQNYHSVLWVLMFKWLKSLGRYEILFIRIHAFWFIQIALHLLLVLALKRIVVLVILFWLD